MTIRPQNLARVTGDLNKALRKKKRLSERGLLAGGFVIERDAKKRTPVERGNLRASAFTRYHPNKEDVVQVGYGAAYALFVHEATDEKLRGQLRPSGLGKYWNPGESEFLAKAVQDKKDEVVRVAAQYIRRRR